MAQITLKGQPVSTVGELPATGSLAPDFTLTAEDLTDRSLADFEGKKKLLNIVPSLDTRVCAASARRFDSEVAKHPELVCLNISADLPFAAKRFCQTEGVNNIVTLSVMRDREFGLRYGCQMSDGPMAGLLSRAIVILDENNTVLYTEQVPEIGQEPDYDRALASIS